MRAVHVVITGLVQGVGYRAWTEHEAKTRALGGWVRNRRDGAVEALFAGPTEAVEEMLRACDEGPAPAVVTSVEVEDTDPPTEGGFRVLPTI